MSAAITMLRPGDVKQSLGICRSTLYLQIQKRLFPPPVQILGTRAVGWPLRECQAINDARIAGKSDAEIRKLVAALVAARKQPSRRRAGL